MAVKKRVLVVDDNESIVRVLEHVLKRAGYEVDTALDGPDAVETAIRVKPDLVLLDIEMPTMDGYEVCRRLRARRDLRNMRIIMLTVKGQITPLGPELSDKKALEQRVREQTDGFDAGADEFLTKPIVAKEVVEQVHRFLNP